MSDKRKEQRTDEEIKVVIQLATQTDSRNAQREMYGLTRDISVGGARIVTDCPLPHGTLCKLNLALSKSRQEVILEGRVKWIKSLHEKGLYEVGVEFMHELPGTIMALMKHLYGHEKTLPGSGSK